MTKQQILFALDVTHPGGAPILPGASWETRDDLAQCWEGDDGPPTLASLGAALVTHAGQEQLRETERQEKSTKKTNLFLDLKTRLATDLNIQVESPADLSGKIEDIIPAARLKRDGKATTGDRLNELEKQVELLTTFVALLSRS